MNRKRILAAAVGAVIVTGALAAHATQYGQGIQLYPVDFAWKKSDGTTNAYSTFTTPQGRIVPYEPVTVSGGTCVEVGATTNNGTDEILWVQQDNGTWIALADDIVNVRDPNAIIYAAATSDFVQTRISDYFNSTPRGQLNVRTRYVEPDSSITHKSYEQVCDEWAAFRGIPYAKKKNGKLTIVKRQGP
jgi:hypothetical protein